MATLATVPRNQQLDLGQYDRSPELTDNENRTFETWAANPLFKLGEYRLPRLFPPLADVLSSDDFEPQGRLRTIRFILEEVGRRRQAYWGWGDAEWLELLHSPAATSNKVTKPYLLAVAYTLGGFRRMYDLRFCFSLPLTARAVFGATLFDHECQRLLKVLRGVGYGVSVSSYPRLTASGLVFRPALVRWRPCSSRGAVRRALRRDGRGRGGR